MRYIEFKIDSGFAGWIGLLLFVVAATVCLVVGWREGRKIVRAMGKARREAVIPVMLAADVFAGLLAFRLLVCPGMHRWGMQEYLPIAAQSLAYSAIPILLIMYLFRPVGGLPSVRRCSTACFLLAVLMLNYLLAFVVYFVFGPVISE